MHNPESYLKQRSGTRLMTICVKGFTDLQKFLMKRINPLAGLIATLPASLSVKLLIAKCHGSRYKKRYF